MILENSPPDIPHLQWFPGHMKKARQIIEGKLKLADVIIELLDARIPVSSANPLIGEIIAGKTHLIVLNKADLADARITKAWVAFFKERKAAALAIDALTGRGLKGLTTAAAALARPRTEKMAKLGGRARPPRVMILGVPNVGKSSLINKLAGAAKAKTANKPGVTRSEQWIKIGGGLELLDTPGLLWPKFADPAVGLHLAFTGAINDDIYDGEQVAKCLLAFLAERYEEHLRRRYKLSEATFSSADELFKAIGAGCGCLLPGGGTDGEKTWRLIMKDFRSGKLGKISLEQPTG